MNAVELISGFPDFKVPGFDIEVYNQQFRERNSVISARSKKIGYDKHWGCLSVKFARGGNEYYQTGNTKYAVNDSNFLLLNNNTEYSSYIDADEEVESFTININENYTHTFLAAVTGKMEDVLEHKPGKHKQEIRFVERLYKKENLVSPVASKIYRHLAGFSMHKDEVAELFTELFINLLKLDEKVKTEINNIHKVKPSTKEELYKRLNYARDYIESCYDQDINLHTIATVACLNTEYFIRQFKLFFGLTPVQYLIQRRMMAAKQLLSTSAFSITEVCQKVGYTDLTTFGKLFRKFYHTSPIDFKNRFGKTSSLTLVSADQ